MNSWIKKIVVGATVLTASVGLAACTKKDNNKKPEETSYTFVNYEDTYTVNQPFSIVGTVLKITTSDGKTIDVTVTEDMIKSAPDMTKIGEQSVIIAYNGKEYEFKITVEQYIDESLISKLKEFLSKYESGKDSLIDIKVSANLVAKYLDQVATVDKEASVELINTMFNKDALANALYNAVFDGLVEGSFDLNEDFIIDSAELKARLDAIKVFESVKSSVEVFDYKTYAVQKVLPETESEEIAAAISYLCDMFAIESTQGHTEIEKLIHENYNKIRNLEKVDVNEAVKSLLECVSEYSNDSSIKDSCNNVLELNSDNLIHFISTTMKTEWLNRGGIITQSEFSNWFYGGEIPELVETESAKNLIKQKAFAEEGLVFAYETAFSKLADVKTAEEVETIVMDLLSAHSEYSSEIVEITQALKANKQMLVFKTSENYYDHVGILMLDLSPQGNTCYNDYDLEIKQHTDIIDVCEKISQNIEKYGFLTFYKNKELIEKILEAVEYPEADKQQAIDKIYAILNQDLYGDELYWAIADVLFPNSDTEQYEIIKNTIRTALEEGIQAAMKENEYVEKLFDLVVGEYPSQDRDKAIQNIYSIIEGQKQGKDFYTAVMEILLPENGIKQEYIQRVVDIICERAEITSHHGKSEVFDLVETNINKILKAEEIDTLTVVKEILTVIETYTNSETIKKSVMAIDSESISEALKIFEVVETVFDEYLSEYPEEYKQQAISNIYSILRGEKKGKDLYISVADILAPNDGEKIIEYTTDLLCDFAAIKTELGKIEVEQVVSRNVRNIINAEGFDAQELINDLAKVVRENTSSEYVKVYASKIDSTTDVKHFISDMIYADFQTHNTITKIDENGLWVPKTTTDEEQAQILLNRYINNPKNMIYNIENALFSLEDAQDVMGVLDVARTLFESVNAYYDEEISIIEELKETDYMIMSMDFEEYEYDCSIENCVDFYPYISHAYNYSSNSYGPSEVVYHYDEIINDHRYVKEQISERAVQIIDIIQLAIEDPQAVIEDLVEEYKEDLIGALLDKVNSFDGDRQQAIDAIASILKGEKQGEELYLAIVNVLLPNGREEVVDKLSDAIIMYAAIESVSGKAEIRDIVDGAVEKLTNAETIDLKQTIKDLCETIANYSTNEYISLVISNLNTEDAETVAYTIADIFRKYMTDNYVVVDRFNCKVPNYQAIETEYANQILEDFINVRVGLVENITNEILNLGEIESFNDVLALFENCLNYIKDYKNADIQLHEEMKNAEFTVGSTCDSDEGVIVEPRVDYVVIEGVVYFQFDEYCENGEEYINAVDWYLSYLDLISDLYNDTTSTLIELVDVYKNDLFGDVLDKIGYPEEYKQQAIDVIASVVKGERHGSELYDAVATLLVPDAGEKYVEYISDLICQIAYVETELGKEKINQAVSSRVENALNGESFSVEEFMFDLFEIIKENTSNDYIKIYADRIDGTKDMKHLLSDMVDKFVTRRYTITKLDQNGNWGQTPTEEAEAQELLNREINNYKNAAYGLENEICSLANANGVVDVLEVLSSIANIIYESQNENISILQDLRKTDYMIMIMEYDAYNEVVDFFPIVGYSILYQGANNKICEYRFDQEIKLYENANAEIHKIIEIVDTVKNVVSDPKAFVDELINQYKEDAIEMVVNKCLNMFGVDSESEIAKDIKDFAIDCVDSYLNGTFNKEETLTKISELIEENSSDEVKTIFKAAYMMYTVINYNEEIDYNEMFKDIELPKEIENVDFNVLMEKVTNVETYDIFKINDIVIDYIANEDGEIIAEQLTLKVDIEFDVMISSIIGDVEIVMTLDFDGK